MKSHPRTSTNRAGAEAFAGSAPLPESDAMRQSQARVEVWNLQDEAAKKARRFGGIGLKLAGAENSADYVNLKLRQEHTAAAERYEQDPTAAEAAKDLDLANLKADRHYSYAGDTLHEVALKEATAAGAEIVQGTQSSQEQTYQKVA